MNYCPICGEESEFLPFGLIQRQNALCPVCNSLERHRFVYFLYQILFMNNNFMQNVLHFAPEKCFADVLSSKKSMINYLPADLYPENYAHIRLGSGRKVIKLDACNIDLPDNSVDVVIANHLAEHLEDDKKFVSESVRVLKKSGVLIFTVPFDINRDTTYENADIVTEEERRIHFGQEDHLRIYGNDVQERFKSEAYTISQIESTVLPDSSREKMGIVYDRAYIVRPK